MKKISLSLTCLFLMSGLNAHAGKIFLMPEIGQTDLSVSEDFRAEDGAADGDQNLVASFLGGYRAESNWMVGLQYTLTGTDGVLGTFDHYELTEFGAFAGYTLPLAERFSLVPAVGVARWDLEHTEGGLFNPGPEASTSAQGTDIVWRLGAEILLKPGLQLAFTYADGNYDFGSASSLRLGLRWEL